MLTEMIAPGAPKGPTDLWPNRRPQAARAGRDLDGLS